MAKRAFKSEGESSSSKAMSDKSEGERVRYAEKYMGMDNYANSPDEMTANPSNMKPAVSPSNPSTKQD